jgi:hypothetical protein
MNDRIDHTALVVDAHNDAAPPNVADSGQSRTRERKKAGASEALRHLPRLLQACCWSQVEEAKSISREVAAALEESHPTIAGQIKKRVGEDMTPRRSAPPEHLLDFRVARHGLEEVILPALLESECAAIVREHQRADELAKFKLAPRHKVLLYGPPGNGKTLLAEALAKELDVPFLPVKYGGLVESYLGQTGKNMQQVFDYAAGGACVVFMDEFDGVAIDRGDAQDVGEIRRVTNQLLLQMDRLPASCVFIAATNAETLLDRAVHRRFDFVMELPAPTIDLRRRCASRELDPELTPGRDLRERIDTVAGLALPNLSALVKLCQRIRRDLVLNDGQGVEAIIAVAVAASRAPS